ncbi:MAG: polyprenol monophosphomannose synthase [Bacteroidota bacterium]
MPDPAAVPPAPDAPRVLVVVPTYEEAVNIRPMLKEILGLAGRYDALVVDDGSPDGTADVVRAVQAEHPGRVHLIERAGKQGLGTAYLTGFRFARDEDYAYVCEMDADFSHNPQDLPLLVEAVRAGADIAMGSRYVGGIRVLNWPLRRLVLSYGAGVYTRAITGMPVMDVTAGFKCFHPRVFEALDFSRIKSNGYMFQIEMTYRAWRKGFTIVEVPITFTERTEGQSKMSKAIVREAALKVWELRFRDLFGKL